MTTKEQVQEIESSIESKMQEMDLEENLLRRFKRTDIIMQMELYKKEKNTLSESFNRNQYPDFYTKDSLVHFQIKLNKLHSRIEKACKYCSLIENREKELDQFSFVEKQGFAYPTLCSMVEQMKLYIITDKYDLIDKADDSFQMLSKKLRTLIEKPFDDYKSAYASFAEQLAEAVAGDIETTEKSRHKEEGPCSPFSVFTSLEKQLEEMSPAKVDPNNISIAVKELQQLRLRFLTLQSKKRNIAFEYRLKTNVQAHLVWICQSAVGLS